MKLYYSPGACSLTVRIVLHELNLNAEYVKVDLKTKKLENGDDYFKINPKGSVPVLQTDDNQVLTENAAILQCIAAFAKNDALLPGLNDFSRFRVLEWLSFVSSDVHKSFGPLFNPNVPEDVKVDVFIPNLKNKLKFIETQLPNKSYLMGDEFTLPDAYLFVVMRWLRKFKIELQEWPNLAKYYERVANRATVKLSLEEEEIKA